MNGQIMSAQAAARPVLAGRGLSASARSRLLLALALSGLLHAAVVFLPYLGKSTRETRLAPAAPRPLPPVLDARLLGAGAPVRQVAAAGAAAAAAPQDNPPPEQRVPGPPQPAPPQRAEGADLLPLAAPVYYTTDQLTRRPQPLNAAELDAPQIQPIVASGKIVLTLWINQFGAVADIAVENSELPELFTRTALATFKDLRFSPGERNGQPVATIMRIEVTYDDGRLKPD